MGDLEKPVFPAEWIGLSEEQIRMLKVAYLMGAKDALRICEVHAGSDLKGVLAESLIGTMDQRFGLVKAKADFGKG